MTLAAQSFIGRALAVFSRRSPGFRPPLTPSTLLTPPSRSAGSRPAAIPGSASPRETPQGETDYEGLVLAGLSLANATAQLKSAPPGLRLQQRGKLFELADLLKAVHHVAETRSHDLRHAFDRARSRNRTQTEIEIISFNRTLARVLPDRTRTFALNLFRDLQLAPDQALAQALDHVRELERVHVRDLHFSLTYRKFRARDLEILRYTGLSLAITRANDLARELFEARDNVVDAANDFVNSDLSGVDPGSVDMTGIRWNNETQWPTGEWADRVRRASAEHPPGSGIFTILPEEDHDPAELHLL